MKLTSFLAVAILNALAIASTLPALAQSTPVPDSPQTGCLSGNPDSTFEGDRPLTRDEFAAGLNACLDQTLQRLQLQQEDLATREDFEATLQRQRELNEELRQLSEQVAPTSDPTSATPNP